MHLQSIWFYLADEVEVVGWDWLEVQVRGVYYYGREQHA